MYVRETCIMKPTFPFTIFNNDQFNVSLVLPTHNANLQAFILF